MALYKPTYIHSGMTATNGGTIMQVTISASEQYTVEALGWIYSTHKDKMVVLYVAEGGIKVEVVFDGKYFYIYRYRTLEALEHYWSTKKSAADMESSRKYKLMADAAVKCYSKIFGRD